MTSLEIRYRRLLGVYPADHRAAYAREMLGVLMEGSRPGQRFPALADTLDVLRNGLLARFSSTGRAERGRGWRDAAGVVALLSAVVLMIIAVRRAIWALRLGIEFGETGRPEVPHGLLTYDVGLRAAAWLAVVLAILIGLRRTAVALGVLATLVELAVIVAWSPFDSFRFIGVSWAPVLAVLTVACLVLAVPARSAGAVLGRRGLALVGASVLLAGLFASGWLPGVFAATRNTGITFAVRQYTLPGPDLLIIGALLLAAVRPVTTPIRRRILVLAAVGAVLPLTQQFLLTLLDARYTRSVTPTLLATELIFMVVAPVGALTLALLALRRSERRSATGGRA
jgi:hypothetical protein